MWQYYNADRKDFNPRPPWGGRRLSNASGFVINGFQSTPSVGRATRALAAERLGIEISIHALRGEGDERAGKLARASIYISIHALRGEGDTGFSRRQND